MEMAFYNKPLIFARNSLSDTKELSCKLELICDLAEIQGSPLHMAEISNNQGCRLRPKEARENLKFSFCVFAE